MKRLSQLDGIRGLAVAIVVLYHLCPVLRFGNSKNLIVSIAYRVLDVGWLGVDIFFVLSGFLITGIILRERSESDFWTAFYARRAFRILPAFIAVFSVTLLALHVFVPRVSIPTGFVLPATLFLANWTIILGAEVNFLSHLWSLAVEEQFYFLWPQAAKRLKSATLLKGALACAVTTEFLRILLALLHVNAYVIYKITPTRMDGLSVGAALAIGLTLPAVQRFLADWWVRIVLSSSALLTGSFLALGGNLFEFNVWSQVLAIPSVVVLTAMLIYGSVESTLPKGSTWLFSGADMVWPGRRSYALYLIHVPLLVAVEESRLHGRLNQLPHTIGVNLLLIVLTILAALILTEASWKLIESPAQVLRRRLMRGTEGVGQVRLSEEGAIVDLAMSTSTRPVGAPGVVIKGENK